MTKETKIMTVREAIKEAMTHEMREDENVFLMGEDVGIFGGDFGTTVGMLEEFGSERVIDTPICEAAICGAAGRGCISWYASNRRRNIYGFRNNWYGCYR